MDIMRRLCAVTVSVLLIPLLCTCAKKMVVLENRYVKGQELRYRMTMKGEGSTSLGGLPGQQKAAQEIPLNLDMDIAYRIAVKNVDADGTADIETYLERFTSVTESGGMKITMEADEEGARMIQGETVINDAPGLEDLKKLFTSPTLMKVNKRGKILSLETSKDSGVMLKKTDLFGLIKQSQLTLPEGAVAVGQSWNEKRDMMMGEGMSPKMEQDVSLKLDATYTINRLVTKEGRNCAEIGMRGEVKAKDLEMGLPQAEGSPMTMKAVFDDLSQKVDGKIYFAIDEGILVAMHLDIEQDITMSMNMSKGDQSMKFTSKTKVKMGADLSLAE